uniref:Uncharacterized protein n=1 Tax=Salix viminalis TaxID=40686 RepID=A0A6N2LTH4_SALVM
MERKTDTKDDEAATQRWSLKRVNVVKRCLRDLMFIWDLKEVAANWKFMEILFIWEYDFSV